MRVSKSLDECKNDFIFAIYAYLTGGNRYHHYITEKKNFNTFLFSIRYVFGKFN